MWDALINALREQIKLQTRPREQLLRAVMRLHEAMLRCHEAYLPIKVQLAEHESALEALKLKTTQDLLKDWHDAIAQLILALWQSRDTLPIFAPEVASALAEYIANEVQNYSQPQAVVNYNELSGEDKEKFGRLVLTLKGAGESNGFETAISELRRFIRENFTMEELYG